MRTSRKEETDDVPQKRQDVAVEVFLISLTTSASAAIRFNQNMTLNVIFGSATANSSLTIDQTNGVELGMRAKQPFPPANSFNSNGDGTYNV